MMKRVVYGKDSFVKVEAVFIFDLGEFTYERISRENPRVLKIVVQMFGGCKNGTGNLPGIFY